MSSPTASSPSGSGGRGGEWGGSPNEGGNAAPLPTPSSSSSSTPRGGQGQQTPIEAGPPPGPPPPPPPPPPGPPPPPNPYAMAPPALPPMYAGEGGGYDHSRPPPHPSVTAVSPAYADMLPADYGRPLPPSHHYHGDDRYGAPPPPPPPRMAQPQDRVDHTYRNFAMFSPSTDDRRRYWKKQREIEKKISDRRERLLRRSCGEPEELPPKDGDKDGEDVDEYNADKSKSGKKRKHDAEPKDIYMGTNFPSRLHEILSRPDLSHIITWMPHGRSWMVLKPDEFLTEVLPEYFSQSKYSSFTRQVNGWGFKRLTQGADHNSYYHEMFLRNMPHLLPRIRRPNAPSRKLSSDPKNEPNFYELSRLYPIPDWFGESEDSPPPPPPQQPPHHHHHHHHPHHPHHRGGMAEQSAGDSPAEAPGPRNIPPGWGGQGGHMGPPMPVEADPWGRYPVGPLRHGAGGNPGWASGPLRPEAEGQPGGRPPVTASGSTEAAAGAPSAASPHEGAPYGYNDPHAVPPMGYGGGAYGADPSLMIPPDDPYGAYPPPYPPTTMAGAFESQGRWGAHGDPASAGVLLGQYDPSPHQAPVNAQGGPNPYDPSAASQSNSHFPLGGEESQQPPEVTSARVQAETQGSSAQGGADGDAPPSPERSSGGNGSGTPAMPPPPPPPPPPHMPGGSGDPYAHHHQYDMYAADPAIAARGSYYGGIPANPSASSDYGPASETTSPTNGGATAHHHHHHLPPHHGSHLHSSSPHHAAAAAAAAAAAHHHPYAGSPRHHSRGGFLGGASQADSYSAVVDGNGNVMPPPPPPPHRSQW